MALAPSPPSPPPVASRRSAAPSLSSFGLPHPPITSSASHQPGAPQLSTFAVPAPDIHRVSSYGVSYAGSSSSSGILLWRGPSDYSGLSFHDEPGQYQEVLSTRKPAVSSSSGGWSNLSTLTANHPGSYSHSGSSPSAIVSPSYPTSYPHVTPQCYGSPLPSPLPPHQQPGFPYSAPPQQRGTDAPRGPILTPPGRDKRDETGIPTTLQSRELPVVLAPQPQYTSANLVPGPVRGNLHNPATMVAMHGHVPVPLHYYHNSSRSQSSAKLTTSAYSERPFKCTECSRAFNRNLDLKHHKRIHLAVKPYPCEFCRKSFSRKDALKRHKLVKGCGEKTESNAKEESGIPTATARPGDDPDNSKSVMDSTPFRKNHKNEMDTEFRVPEITEGERETAEPQMQVLQGKGTRRQDIKQPTTPGAGRNFSSASSLHIHSVANTDPRNSMRIRDEAPEAPLLTPIPSEMQTIPLKLREESAETPVSQTPRSEISSIAAESRVDERKAKIIDNVVLYATLRIRRAFYQVRGDRGGSGTSKPTTTELSRPSVTTTGYANPFPQQSGTKRKLADRDNFGTDDEDDPDPPNPNDGRTKGEENARYACPYFKYNPAMYKSARNCPGPGWPTVRRVKEHLYRRHRQPAYRCGRCWQPFKDKASELDHQRMPQPCPLRDMEHVEGFDAAQERNLRSRKRANPEPSEPEKWREVYRILFPHVEEDEIPSPFYEYAELASPKPRHQMSDWEHLAECEAYLLREVPPRLRQALDRELDRDLGIVEESLRRKATACVKTLIAEAFQELRRIPGAAAESSSGLPETTAMGVREEGAASAEGPGEFSFEGVDMQFMDAFTLLGDQELGFDQGGLMEHLLSAPRLEGDGEGGKLSDSGYGSNSPEMPRRELTDFGD